MSNERDLRRAKKHRDEMIARLQACQCVYPIITLRNGSGHASNCPAHKLWEEQKAAREENS